MKVFQFDAKKEAPTNVHEIKSSNTIATKLLRSGIQFCDEIASSEVGKDGDPFVTAFFGVILKDGSIRIGFDNNGKEDSGINNELQNCVAMDMLVMKWKEYLLRKNGENIPNFGEWAEDNGILHEDL